MGVRSTTYASCQRTSIGSGAAAAGRGGSRRRARSRRATARAPDRVAPRDAEPRIAQDIEAFPIDIDAAVPRNDARMGGDRQLASGVRPVARRPGGEVERIRNDRHTGRIRCVLALHPLRLGGRTDDQSRGRRVSRIGGVRLARAESVKPRRPGTNRTPAGASPVRARHRDRSARPRTPGRARPCSARHAVPGRGSARVSRATAARGVPRSHVHGRCRSVRRSLRERTMRTDRRRAGVPCARPRPAGRSHSGAPVARWMRRVGRRHRGRHAAEHRPDARGPQCVDVPEEPAATHLLDEALDVEADGLEEVLDHLAPGQQRATGPCRYVAPFVQRPCP